MALLASAEELATHLQRPLDRAAAELALAGASGVVRSYCGWNLLLEDTTFVVDGQGTTILTLPTLHLVAVDEIRIGGLPIDPDGPQPVVHRRGQLIWANTWPNLAPVEVDVTHGFATTPDVVRLVSLTIAARLFDNPHDVTSASVGSVSRTWGDELTKLDMRLLDPYRLE